MCISYRYRKNTYEGETSPNTQIYYDDQSCGGLVLNNTIQGQEMINNIKLSINYVFYQVPLDYRSCLLSGKKIPCLWVQNKLIEIVMLTKFKIVI